MMHWSIAVNESTNFGDNQSYLMVIVKMKQMKWIDYSNLIEVKLAIITLLLFRTKQMKSKGYRIHSRMHSKQVDDDAIENATLNKMIWNWREIEIQNYLIKSFKCRFSLAHKILIGIRLAYERECLVCLAWLCDRYVWRQTNVKEALLYVNADINILFVILHCSIHYEIQNHI